MAWNGLRMTVDGRNALNQAQMADKMLFKSIVVGDGQAPANFNTQRALVHQLYEITAIQVDVRGDMCVLTADFPAVDYDYYFREIGVVAQTEDGDKLYVYDNCGEDAQYIVTTTGTEKTRKRIRISLKISDVAEITVVNPEILCVAYDDFDKLVEKVKEKVAAVGGDVASTIASAFTESKDPYPIPQAGESIKVILGKVVKFFNDVKTGCCKIGDIVNNCTSTDTDKPLAAAVGKVLWDKIVDAVAALATHKSSADHDGRYYTESEINTKLGGKSDTSHNHDGTYVKKNTVAEVSGIQVGKKETNGYGWIDIYHKSGTYFSFYPFDETRLDFDVHGRLQLGLNINTGLFVKLNPVITTRELADNCTSTDTDKAPTARQAKVLMDKCNQLNSDLSPIGSTKWADSNGNVSVPSGAEKQLASVSVPAGTWIVKGSVNFQSESSAGSRVAQLRQGGNNIAVQEVQGNANGWTKLTVNDILVLTATTTIAIIAKQTSGGAIICDGYLGLVRIK